MLNTVVTVNTDPHFVQSTMDSVHSVLHLVQSVLPGLAIKLGRDLIQIRLDRAMRKFMTQSTENYSAEELMMSFG